MCSLLLTPAMLIIKQHPRSISVLPGSKVIFESAFVADGDATYLWKRDDDSKLDVGRTSGINSKRLTISNVMPSDAGSYVCVTSQKSTDIVSDKVILHVKKGVPMLECITLLCTYLVLLQLPVPPM